MDKNIFATGWNSENAYIFGWVMSDGCLLREGRNKTSYAIRIGSRDYDIIAWLHDHMCSGNKIYKMGENAFQIKYRNQEAIRFMMDIGLTERKSLNMPFPTLPIKYLADFVRGYFDGDGSIILKETKYNTYSQVSFTCGSLIFLEMLQGKLAFVGINSHIYKDGRTTNNAYYLRLTKRSDIEKLYKFMYYDISKGGFLERKYKKYNSFMKIKPKYKSHIA